MVPRLPSTAAGREKGQRAEGPLATIPWPPPVNGARRAEGPQTCGRVDGSLGTVLGPIEAAFPAQCTCGCCTNAPSVPGPRWAPRKWCSGFTRTSHRFTEPYPLRLPVSSRNPSPSPWSDSPGALTAESPPESVALGSEQEGAAPSQRGRGPRGPGSQGGGTGLKCFRRACVCTCVSTCERVCAPLSICVVIA